VETPLLKAYLRELPGQPPHLPGWINWAGWGVFLATAALSMGVFDGECFGLVAAIALGFATVFSLRQRYQPRNDHERAEEQTYAAVRKLKYGIDEGSLHKRLPPEVLTALEGAMTAHNGALARLSGEDPTLIAERSAALRRALHACFLAAGPVIRGPDQGRREWQAVGENRTLINEVLEAIHRQTMRMREPHLLDTERLAALRELGDYDETVVRPLGH
jgi:hypothetical protein